MMKNKLMYVIVATLFFAFAAFSIPAESWAAPGKVKSVTRLERNLQRSLKRLQRRFNRLTLKQKSKAVSLRSGKSEDSDSDGVPDSFEDSSGRCDSDSDDDGLDDGDEYKNGYDPDDSDSDDDGHDDGNEIEKHGLITTISASEIVVAGMTFSLSANTEYLGRNNEPLTNGDFSVGECVEVEGHAGGTPTPADKVKRDDDCGGSSDDDD